MRPNALVTMIVYFVLALIGYYIIKHELASAEWFERWRITPGDVLVAAAVALLAFAVANRRKPAVP